MVIKKKGLTEEDYIKAKNIYFICSYMGCGTCMLYRALSNNGNIVRLCHDRNPPDELEYIFFDCKKYKEDDEELKIHDYVKFNGIKVPEKILTKVKVIYLFKNPINSIYSRLRSDSSSKFMTDGKYTLTDVLTEEKDLFGLEDFFDNYTKENNNRNYEVICVNYHELFDKQEELEKVLGCEKLNLIKRERKHEQENFEVLDKIYKNLNDKINNMPFIKIV